MKKIIKDVQRIKELKSLIGKTVYVCNLINNIDNFYAPMPVKLLSVEFYGVLVMSGTITLDMDGVVVENTEDNTNSGEKIYNCVVLYQDGMKCNYDSKSIFINYENAKRESELLNRNNDDDDNDDDPADWWKK